MKIASIQITIMLLTLAFLKIIKLILAAAWPQSKQKSGASMSQSHTFSVSWNRRKLIRHETGDARNELDRPRRHKQSSANFRLERLLTIGSCLIIGIVKRNSKEKIINMERREGTQNITWRKGKYPMM